MLLWLLRQSIPIGQGEHNKSAPGVSSIAKRVNAAQLLLISALFAAKLMSDAAQTNVRINSSIIRGVLQVAAPPALQWFTANTLCQVGLRQR